jgi:phage shock protein A
MKKAVKKTTEKYLTETKFRTFEKTFESSMQSIAKSFSRVEDTMLLIVKEIRTIHEENRNFRQSISGLNSDGISYERKIENLTARVEKLEAKI